MTSKKLHKIIDFIGILIAIIIIIIFISHLKVIWESFYSSIILSNAYIGIISGLKVTIMLTLVGSILGTFFGAVICSMRMSRIKSLNVVGKIVIEVLRGTPVVMLLMFLYFFVFLGNSIDALYIAMLGYGMNTGAHMAEIFRTSIEAINYREIEAARMLGFSKIKAFYYITLPQSWKVAKPIYESAIITLIQWTSVAGYISVTELTRIINGLGSRTGNPFFSLFLGILIYLVLAYSVRIIFWLSNMRGES